jgi:Condensation domain/Phosphopantetheine attachment site
MLNHDAVDKTVMDVVRQVLDRTDITADDNFFDIGGRSILALRVIQRINGLLSIKLPIRSLYEARDLRQFVEETRLLAAAPRSEMQGRVLPERDRTRLPASFTQFHIVTEALRHPNSLQFNLPFSLHIAGFLDVARLAAAMRKAVQFHEVLRVRFDVSEGQCWQIPHDSPEFDLTPIRVDDFPRAAREGILADLINCENAIPISVLDHALLRATLLQIDKDEHLLLLCFHHIAVDGRSIRIFVDDLFRLYDNMNLNELRAVRGQLQFGDIVSWQARQHHHGHFRKHIEYWLRALAPPWQTHTLNNRPADQRNAGQGLVSRQIMFPTAHTDALEALAAHWKVALQALYLAAIAGCLMHHGMRDVRIAVQVDGRTRAEFETVVGPLIATVVLRMDVSGVSAIRAIAELANQKLFEAYDHADLPPETIMQAISERVEMPLSELCQVLLVMDDVYPPLLHADGLTVARYESDPSKSIQLDHIGPFMLIFAVKWTGSQFGLQLTAKPEQDDVDDILNRVIENLAAFIECRP